MEIKKLGFPYGLPLLSILALALLAAPITIWGLDQSIIYKLSYNLILKPQIPTHGTVSSLGLLFPPGMIWLSLPFVVLFKNLVTLSIVLLCAHAIILLICLNSILKRIDASYLKNKIAYLAAASYLLFDISLILTGTNLWEQYISRTLIVLLFTLIFISFYSRSLLCSFLTGYLTFFLPGIHPIPAVWLPFIILIYSGLFLTKKITLKNIMFFLIGAATSFLQIWLPWILSSQDWKESVNLIATNISLRPLGYYINLFVLAIKEWGKMLSSANAGTILQLLDQNINSELNFNSLLTIVLSTILATIRWVFTLTIFSWSVFYSFRQSLTKTKSGRLFIPAFIVAIIYGACYISYVLILFIGFFPFSQRPDYGGQFIGLCNFATSIGIYFLLVSNKNRLNNRTKLIFVAIQNTVYVGCITLVLVCTIFTVSIAQDIKHPKQLIYALMPSEERMKIVKMISGDIPRGNKTTTFTFRIIEDNGSLTINKNCKWTSKPDRFYEPHMLFSILFKRFGKKLNYVEINKNPDYIITIPPREYPEEIKNACYQSIYNGFYCSIWKKPIIGTKQ
ncbi:MAG: hypothetical protein PHH69_00230 [Candidatus Omnitrophica bacterium]|nr:hypothetical protein [Candidatus Omnitrophota bacterium]